MLCATIRGWFNGNSDLCGIHLLYNMLFCDDHWQRYRLYLIVTLYLSLVSIGWWFDILYMGNFSGSCMKWEGGLAVVVVVVVGDY